MTLAASSAVDRYAAVEDQTIFPYTFKILDAAHLRIYEDDLEVTTGFTVSGVGNDTGGNVTIRFLCQIQAGGKLAVIDDGATAQVTLNPSPIFDDGVWHKLDVVRVSSTERHVYVDGVLIISSTTDAGSLSSSGNLPLGIGVEPNGSSAPALLATLSLAHLSATAPSAAQVRQMHDAERPMFVANAKCLLQSATTDAVLDVSVDPVTGKVAVTQTDSQVIFDGLAIETERTIATGGTTFEGGRIYGGRFGEINDANLYAELAAEDLRDVAALVEGLKAGLPAGIDLSNAKAFVFQNSNASTPGIYASMNVKSVTRTAQGLYLVEFNIPFKDKNYLPIFAGGNYPVVSFDHGNVLHTRHQARVRVEHTDGTEYDSKFVAVFFGELENE